MISSPSASSPEIDWLLDPSEPSFCYLASRDLVSPKPTAARLARLRADVTKRGFAARILARQRDGWWGPRRTGYQPKFRSAIWQLQILADLGVTRADDRIEDAVERFFSLHLAKDGGYCPTPNIDVGHHCLTGNMARSLQRFGYERDERVVGALAWIVRTQTPDGGWHCFTTKYGTLDAWEGLSALAEVAPHRRTRLMRDSIKRGAEFYLERRLLHEGKPSAPWSWLRYPPHYHYNVLMGLDFLTKLGHGRDQRLDEAFAILQRKRLADGRWAMDRPLPDHSFEQRGEPSRMVTFLALRAYKRAGRSPNL